VTLVTIPLRGYLSPELSKHFRHLSAPLGLLFCPFREELVDQFVHDPARRIAGSGSSNLAHPSECCQLLEYYFGIALGEPAHGAIAALDVPVGDDLEPMCQDVEGHSAQPVMVISKPKDTDIEGKSRAATGIRA
jgi:hypothetical protein